MPTHRDLPDDEPSRYSPPPGEPVGIDALLSFDGRINRATFWTTWVVLVVVGAAAVTGMKFINPDSNGLGLAATVVAGVLMMIFAFLFLFVSLANEAKRYHDMDLSAWWILLNLIPGLGALVLLALGFLPGTRGENRFGQQPLKIRLNPD
jgi:uncharacterized membrane protein YhaH (DUF805 family)